MRSLFILFLLLCMPITRAHALFDSAQISNLSDVTFPTWNIGDGAVSANIDICIYSIGVLSSTDYGVTISAPGGYVLKDGTRQIPFSLFWEDSGFGNLGSNSGVQLSNNVKLNSRKNPNIFSTSCNSLGSNGPTARLYIKITQADMTAALAGNYSNTLTILISAD